MEQQLLHTAGLADGSAGGRADELTGGRAFDFNENDNGFHTFIAVAKAKAAKKLSTMFGDLFFKFLPWTIWLIFSDL